MDFRDGGELHYTIPTDGRDFEVELIYRVVGGDVLLTENRSNPHSAATHFELGPGDVLVFDFAGARALFVRETE
jgi:hypothetical protein